LVLLHLQQISSKNLSFKLQPPDQPSAPAGCSGHDGKICSPKEAILRSPTTSPHAANLSNQFS
jgi:hypothetical protein